MTPEEFVRRLKANKSELSELVHRKAPRLAGVRALNFYKENYRKGGYMNGGFHPWPITKRQKMRAKGAAGKYGPLLSKRNRMFGAFDYTAGDAIVTVYNDTPYAVIHNEGGTVRVPVTEDMRKYFWAMYYQNGGGKKESEEAERYKWMALTKKRSFTIKIPKRQMLYESRELTELIRQMLKDEITKILK